ncbi:MAG: elongation factor G [Victivallales bacterium]|nr:elongation factor G [Victivallales bacterium]
MPALDKIRNISIIAHIDAGKTSTTEGILYYSGLTHRIGSIDDGTTVMDFLPEERARGITIMASAATIPWRDYHFHLIDTPGHIDFTAEVERSLRVIDGAVVIFSAVEGVEAQSEKVWRQADGYGVPKIAFVNKMDRVGASFERTVGQIDEKFGKCALPLQLPLGAEDTFEGMLDVLTKEQIHFTGERNSEILREPLTAEQETVWQEAYDRLISIISDDSDEVAELYLSEEPIPLELLKREIRRLTLARKVVPVFVGSAKKDMGVQPLCDGIIDYLPSPLDCAARQAFLVKTGETTEVAPSPNGDFTGFIFKVNASKTADLFFLRVYSGRLKTNATVTNSRTGEKVRARQIFRVYAKSTELVDEAVTGDIVGITGLKDCGIGDTLCDGKHPIAFDSIRFPEPVISMVVEPKSIKDKDKLDEALEMLCREDQTLQKSISEDTKQRILSGMGELHLEINLKRLMDEFHLEIRCGEPRVAYRETFQARTTEHVLFDKVLGDVHLATEVTVSFQPMDRSGEMFDVSNAVKPGAQVPRAIVQTGERTLLDALHTGGLSGYPLIFVKAVLEDIKYLPDLTTEGAVAGAVVQAMEDALQHVGTVILEPLMHLEVTAPESCMGDITMYLQPRRAIIRDMATVGTVRKLVCEVPLAEMFGFGKALPRLSGGRGSFTMEPSGYQELPKNIANTQSY